MAKRGKRNGRLPRVTLLAYSARDLLRFAESVERLSLLVNDLSAQVAELKRSQPAKRKPPARTPDASAE